jgi:hypothetical protein
MYLYGCIAVMFGAAALELPGWRCMQGFDACLSQGSSMYEASPLLKTSERLCVLHNLAFSTKNVSYIDF